MESKLTKKSHNLVPVNSFEYLAILWNVHQHGRIGQETMNVSVVNCNTDLTGVVRKLLLRLGQGGIEANEKIP